MICIYQVYSSYMTNTAGHIGGIYQVYTTNFNFMQIPDAWGRGWGRRRALRGGSSSQPPPELDSMLRSEDEDLELRRASKVLVFHSITYGK